MTDLSKDEIRQRAYDDTPDPMGVTILFSMWYNDAGKKPEELGPEYDDLKVAYANWLKARGYA